MRISLAVTLLALVSISTAARADEPAATVDRSLRDWPFAPHAIVRLGHYAPMGNAFADQPLGDYSGRATMFFLGAGARVNNVVVDLIFGIGGAGTTPASEQALEAEGFDPFGNMDVHFGVEGTYQFRRGSRESMTPWAGLGLGYEVFGPGGTRGDREHLAISHSGPALRLMGGVDFPLNGWFGLGVGAELGLGRFGSHSYDYSVDDDVTTFEDDSYSETGDLDLGAGTHTWLGLSVRAVFLP